MSATSSPATAASCSGPARESTSKKQPSSNAVTRSPNFSIIAVSPRVAARLYSSRRAPPGQITHSPPEIGYVCWGCIRCRMFLDARGRSPSLTMGRCLAGFTVCATATLRASWETCALSALGARAAPPHSATATSTTADRESSHASRRRAGGPPRTADHRGVRLHHDGAAGLASAQGQLGHPAHGPRELVNPVPPAVWSHRAPAQRIDLSSTRRSLTTDPSHEVLTHYPRRPAPGWRRAARLREC